MVFPVSAISDYGASGKIITEQYYRPAGDPVRARQAELRLARPQQVPLPRCGDSKATATATYGVTYPTS